MSIIVYFNNNINFFQLLTKQASIWQDILLKFLKNNKNNINPKKERIMKKFEKSGAATLLSIITKLLVLIIIYISCPAQTKANNTLLDSLAFKRLNDLKGQSHYGVFRLMTEPILVDSGRFASQWKKEAELIYINLSEPHWSLKAAYLHPGKSILVTTDSTFQYLKEENYIQKTRYTANKFIVYEDEALRNEYDFEQTNVPARETYCFYIALFLAGLGFALNFVRTLNKVIITILFSASILFLAGIIYVLGDNWALVTIGYFILIFFPGLGVALTWFLSDSCQGKGNPKNYKKIGRNMLLISSLAYFGISCYFISFLTVAGIALNSLFIGLATMIVLALIIWGIQKMISKSSNV